MRYVGAFGDLDRTMIALADPVRREIIVRLTRGPARVTDIAAAFPISLNSVSKHVRMLERAGLIDRAVLGREHILTFRPEPLGSAQKWISTQQHFWASRLQAIDDLLSAQDAANTGKENEDD
ncbi:ArsR/SmtB family transcription factor [Mycolicibacterium lutetiense]